MNIKDNKKYSTTVIIPFFNGHKWIKRSLNSVVNQTVMPSEIIMVDDGSVVPLTIEYIKENIDNKERIKLIKVIIIRNEKNQGISASRNIGLNASVSNFITFLDQDDEWLPSKLEKQINHINEQTTSHECFGVFSPVIVIDEKSGKQKLFPDKKEIDICRRKNTFEWLLFSGNYIPIISLFVERKKLIEIGGFNCKIKGGADDYDLVLRLTKSCKILIDDSTPNAIRYIHGENFSDPLKFIEDRMIILQSLKQNNFVDDRLYRQVFSQYKYREGRFWQLAGQWSFAKKAYVSAIKSDFNLKAFLMTFACWLRVKASMNIGR